MPISALIVAVPEADALVAGVRRRYDATAKLGVPAHVTILVPFVAPMEITAGVLQRVRDVVAAFEPFDYRLSDLCRWPQTAFLAPEPADRFIKLTESFVAAFPAYPPYEGRHAEIIPHLTIADGNADDAAAAERELRPEFERCAPIACCCSEITWLAEGPDRWTTLHTLPLGR